MKVLSKDELKKMEPVALDAHIVELVSTTIGENKELLEEKERIARNVRLALMYALSMPQEVNLPGIVESKIKEALMKLAHKEYLELMDRICRTNKEKQGIRRSLADFRKPLETTANTADISTYEKWKIIKEKKLQIGDVVSLTEIPDKPVKITGFTSNCDVQVRNIDDSRIFVEADYKKRQPDGQYKYIGAKVMYNKEGNEVKLNDGIGEDGLGKIISHTHPNNVEKRQRKS